MPVSTRLVVLRTTPLGERSLVMHTISREWGRRSFIVPAGKSQGLYVPLSILDAEALENPRSDLWRLKGVSAVYPLTGLRSGAFKNAIVMFMAEVLYRTVTDGSGEAGLYEFCESSILMLDALEGDFSNFHICWLLGLCSVFGFAASTADMAPFAGNCLQDLQKFLELPFSQAMLLPLSGSRRSELVRAIVKYLSAHLEANIEIRSIEVFSSIIQ